MENAPDIVYLARRDPRHVIKVELFAGVFAEYELGPDLEGVDQDKVAPVRQGLITDLEGLKKLRNKVEDTLRKDPRLLIRVAGFLTGECAQTIML